ncbi:MAG: hypothetical protein MJ183_03355 [Treponemataceae bacterium]|nr:hypothetical protein [Treponemataceae bacterium]
MKKIFFIIAAVFLATSLFGAEKFNGYWQAETEHFVFVYDDSGRETAEAFAAVAEKAWANVAKVYAFPQEKTTVTITTGADIINAFTMFNSYYMAFFDTPMASPEFGFRTDWHELFFTHELIHIANGNFEGKYPSWLQYLGSIWAALDTTILEGVSLEGLTTVLETELTAGGRGRSPYFELYYKAPAMENGFIDYLEATDGSMIYILGYVTLRSIVDRWGISTLADIERNRGYFDSWGEAVRTVTGEDPEVIYNDVRKSLDKRYNKERLIPEGITVTPHVAYTDYMPKPLIKDDNSILAFRSSYDGQAAVCYDPATDEETVLFEGNFADIPAFSENGLAVASLQTFVLHNQPGQKTVSDLYTWTEETGLVQLTQGTSFFSPALSRDGKRLVAAQVNKGHYRIVEVSLEDGSWSVLLEKSGIDYVSPSLNADGSKLVCLEADGTHAEVVVLDSSGTLTPVYNHVSPDANPEEIMDPGYPAFLGDKITFSSNQRGRLEVWECNADGSELEPVVADPVGAVWAYKNDRIIWYSSYSTTGWVIKTKPAEEWGVVPDYEGPSMPGKIITFGDKINDYPDFVPYVKDIPIFEKRPVESSTLANEAFDKVTANEAAGIKTVLSDEKRYWDLPVLAVAIPEFSLLSGKNEDLYFGFGAGAFGMSRALQADSRGCWAEADLIYYPSLNQIAGNLLYTKYAGTSLFVADLYRILNTTSDNYKFTEYNGLMLNWSLPLYSIIKYQEEYHFGLVFGGNLSANRQDSKEFALNAPVPYEFSTWAVAGIDAGKYQEESNYKGWNIQGSMQGVFTWQPNINLAALLAQGTATVTRITADGGFSANLRGRWYDLPSDAIIPLNSFDLKAESTSCLYPGNLIIALSYDTRFDGSLNRLFAETQVKFGKNTKGQATPDNGTFLNVEKTVPFFTAPTYVGYEIGLDQWKYKVLMGVVSEVNALFDLDFSKTHFYLTVKCDMANVNLPDIFGIR